ncbi:MAG TPA: hypothetical protein VH184_23480 [Dongiaceae bacterium]|jgi:hypothetical protein|nr:hypothetical protein [Dongiaceae bacterium]
MTVDFDDGEAGKQDGMARAEAGANPEWQAYMMALIVEVARLMPAFTTDILERKRLERGGPSTHEPRAYGPLMSEAGRREIIYATEDYSPSTQASAHKRPKRVWISKIYIGNHPIRYRHRRIIDPRQYDLDL